MISHGDRTTRSRDTTGSGGGPTAAELCPFPAETRFGQYIKHLFDALNPIVSEISRESYRKQANALANFYRPGGIAVSGIRHIELTEGDQKFMMGHPVGDTIRRVHLHYWLAETFAEAVERHQTPQGMPSKAADQIKRVCDILQRLGFSRFANSKNRTFLGDDQGVVLLGTEIRFSGLAFLPPNSLKAVIDDVAKACTDRAQDLLPAYEKLREQGLRVITDPYHMWEALSLNLRPLLESKSLAQDLVKQMGQQVFLVIEDNQAYHEMYRPFFELESISFFGPHGIEGSTSKSGRIFTESEAALELLQQALQSKLSVPSVLIADIELGPDRMNGLDFLEQAHDLYTRYGRRNEVILACATSSHLSLYQERLDALKHTGIIDCGYRKTYFPAEDLARIIAEHAQH